jgi:hypothetical protein
VAFASFETKCKSPLHTCFSSVDSPFGFWIKLNIGLVFKMSIRIVGMREGMSKIGGWKKFTRTDLQRGL